LLGISVSGLYPMLNILKEHDRGQCPETEQYTIVSIPEVRHFTSLPITISA
jgi:hypothetical protein